MKKRRLGLIVLFFTLMALCACGSSSQDEPDFTYIPKADEYEQKVISHYLYQFSSGRAWVEFSYEGENDRSLGCIDKAGNLLFAFEPESILKNVPFESGVSYVRDRQGVIYIINDQGEVLTSSIEVPFAGIISYGDGYFLAYRNKEGFDSDSYEFLIIDHTGEVIKELDSKDCIYVSWEDFKTAVSHQGHYDSAARYCGDGMFLFLKRESSPNAPCLYLFYDAKNDTFTEKECDYSQYLTSVENGMCCLEIGGEKVLFDMSNQTDNLVQLREWIDLVRSEHKDVLYSSGPLSNGKVVYTFYNSYKSHWDEPLYACAYADKTGMYPIDAYHEYMSAEYSARLAFDQAEDRLLLRFVGKDSNYYLAIIDSEGTTIMEPLKCEDNYSSDFFNCGRFIAGAEDNIMIYDTDGNAVFSLNDIGGSSISEFSDDVAIIDQNKSSAKAVDIYGNILFDNINTASNQYITLSSG